MKNLEVQRDLVGTLKLSPIMVHRTGRRTHSSNLLKDRDALLEAKSPYTLCPLYETENNRLPFVYIKGFVHPFRAEQGDPLPRYNEKRSLNVDATYDIGNAVTRICEIFSVSLEAQDVEPCILTFE